MFRSPRTWPVAFASKERESRISLRVGQAAYQKAHLLTFRNCTAVFRRAGVLHTSSDLRHTYPASFLETGGDIRLLSKALGHLSITVTEKLYAHFTMKQEEMLDPTRQKDAGCDGRLKRESSVPSIASLIMFACETGNGLDEQPPER